MYKIYVFLDLEMVALQRNGENSATFLLAEIDSSILILKNKVKVQKRRAHIVHGLLIILGALITLVLGVNIPNYEVCQKNIALVLGAILTIVSSWNVVFDYKKLWFRQKSTLLNLYQLRNEITYHLTLDVTEISHIDDLFEQYQDVWKQDGNEWRSIYKKKNTKEYHSSLQQE